MRASRKPTRGKTARAVGGRLPRAVDDVSVTDRGELVRY